MNFTLPKRRIKESIWFLTETDQLKHGFVDLVSILINENECKIYYGVEVPNNDPGQVEYHTILEEQVMELDPNLPNPKWHIGDNVKFVYMDGRDKKFYYDEGKIERIEIYVTDHKDKVEVAYFMEEDPDYAVMEGDIEGFAERVIKPLEDDQGEGIPV